MIEAQHQRGFMLSTQCSSKGNVEGICLSGEDCFSRGGQVGNVCGTDELYCCTFVKTCGDVSKELVSYFQSPDYPAKSTGTLACDYDIMIQDDICAVRVDYEKVNLARKLGGLCDIDQIFILNSVDGPTTGQCGPLTGYATLIAVDPNQSKPLKLAVLIQNEEFYRWFVKITQIPCSKIRRFKVPEPCGIRKMDLNGESSNHLPVTNPLSGLLHWWNKVRWKNAAGNNIWWSYPEPVFNTFYYESTKRHMQEQVSRNSNRLHNAQRRIISGMDAEIGEFPWMVAIGFNKMFFCGGALISDVFVLTAAHCFMTRDTPIESLIVQLGDYDLIKNNETNHVLRGVERIFFHSHFHAFLLANDIAVLQLDDPVIFSVNIQPICLPDPGDSYKGRRATVTGWGISSVSTGNPSSILQKLQVTVLTNRQCAIQIDDRVGSGMICASPSDLGGTCFGDSGGPLSVENDGIGVLIGIVSFGVTGCAIIPAFPDLYTRVTEYINWIDVNTI
ncbi:uncharacterized protein LOC142324567 [Lycorma delicatula]|uniref:uncharacterized protein LOC142324567 n=1 Tax=Lycorma delicatula TaxID=130591 RepID=UPI003F5132AC